MSEKEIEKTRVEHIFEILCKFKLSRITSMPTATEEQSFEEALRRVVHVVSSKEYAPAAEGTCNSYSSACNRKSDRKQCLKKILDRLYWLERNRLYDPPSDNEIGQYLIIRNYTGSILAFHLAAALLYDELNGPIFFRSISLFVTKDYAETIMEVNQHLADLSEFLLEMNIEDVTPLKPWINAKDTYEMKTLINGSKERSYMFYRHKFNLALADLKSSEFAIRPPLKDEEKSYVQALDGISSPLFDEMDVFSEELFSIYLEWIHQHIIDIERYFEQIKRWILKNLSLMEWWEASEKHVKEKIAMYRRGPVDDDEEEEEDILISQIREELTEQYEFPIGDLPNYISKIDDCLTVTLFVDVLTDSISWNRSRLGLLRTLRKWKQAGWEAVHALTLLKNGGPTGCRLQEQPILRNPQKHEPLENHQATRQPEHILDAKDQDENIAILDGIINDLKCIGDSEIILDEEEREFVRKILGNVASAIHFYVSAMAYEQRRYVTQHCGSFDVSMLQLPEAKPKRTIDLEEVRNWKFRMRDSIKDFVLILVTFKDGLEEKLRSL